MMRPPVILASRSFRKARLFEDAKRRTFATDHHKTITLALYRQLLRWCHETDSTIPLSIPPIHLGPPQILPFWKNTKDLEPPFDTSVVSQNGITIGKVRSSDHARELVRALFRRNGDAKEQVSLAFEWIKSLNELTPQLEELKKERQSHIDRDGVDFCIGQIVKHKTLRWRGVVVGWKFLDDSSTNKTSLTQKSYRPDEVLYEIALDWGDATLLHSHGSFKKVSQSDLVALEDPDLVRIKTATEEYFSRFDTKLLRFVPNETLAYVYPLDVDEGRSDPIHLSRDAAKAVGEGIQSFAEHLRRILLGYTSAPEVRNLSLLSSYLERLTQLTDNVLSVQEIFQDGKEKEQIQKFVELAVEIEDTLWTRRKALEGPSDHPKFGLGDVVQHKKYGFRGVVVAWDPEPVYDVSRWDGLQHIDHPEEYPFYHVIPDPNDAKIAFGGDRPWRYVCEENLEACPQKDRDLQVELEGDWTRGESGKFNPPNELKFRHGESLEDDGLTLACLNELKVRIRVLLGFTLLEELHSLLEDNIQAEINDLFARIREPENATDRKEIERAAEKISMENLFQMLKYADNSETATVLSDAFKEIWKAHRDNEIRHTFNTGVNLLLTGKTEKALSLFGEVVDRDPSFAEAWNKAATCEFMIGNLDASMAAAQKTLELIPDHFQALNGLGLVYNEKRELLHAKDTFRKSIQLDPWSPVAPRLSVCLDTLEKWNETSLWKNDPETEGGPEWKNPITGK